MAIERGTNSKQQDLRLVGKYDKYILEKETDGQSEISTDTVETRLDIGLQGECDRYRQQGERTRKKLIQGKQVKKNYKENMINDMMTERQTVRKRDRD